MAKSNGYSLPPLTGAQFKTIMKNSIITSIPFSPFTMIQSEGSITNPIYQPKKHTVESYRSQQRKAKQRRKSNKR